MRTLIFAVLMSACGPVETEDTSAPPDITPSAHECTDTLTAPEGMIPVVMVCDDAGTCESSTEWIIVEGDLNLRCGASEAHVRWL